jgi:hypothetical protein
MNVWWLAVMGLILMVGSWAAVGASQTRPQSSAAPTTSSKALYNRLSGPQTKNPGAWPYADAYDSVMAAGEVYHTRYEDEHVRLVEVAYFPGVHSNMHGHPWPSVFASDSLTPMGIVNVTLDPDSPLNGQGGGHAPPPQGMQYPTCWTLGPQAPHAVTNNDTFPLHFYRLEFKRIDGDGIKTNWKTWYPWMLLPLKPISNIDPRDPKLGPPISKEYPFAAATESYKAAPNNHQLRYEDDHILFLEVTFRPGERENLHGHANPSVFARDTGASPVSGPTPIPAAPPAQLPNHEPGIGKGAGGDYKLDPNGVNGQGGGSGAAPAGMKWPSCSTMGPQWPHAASTTNDYPTHFYRIQFKRIDGDGIKAHWREWYPWMAKLADDYKAHPTPSNY